MPSRQPGPPPPTDRAYWHPERREGRPRPPRYQPCGATGKPFGDPRFLWGDAQAVARTFPGSVQLILDRRTGQYHDPYTRERVHVP